MLKLNPCWELIVNKRKGTLFNLVTGRVIRISDSKIDISPLLNLLEKGCNKNLIKLIGDLREKSIGVKLIYATLDFPVNIVICLLIYEEYPYISFGFGSGNKIEEVSLKSIAEAILVRNTLLLLKKYNYDSYMRETDIKSFLDHAVFASYNPKLVNWVQKLKENKIKPINHKITLDYLKKELSKRNMNAYFVDISKEIFKRIGFHQSKTIIPSLCQRDMNNNYKFLNNERLNDVPKDFGYKIKYNLAPHPFA